MKTYEENYEKFWKDIVENEDGSFNIDQVKRELNDLSILFENYKKIIFELSGHNFSNPLTKAEVVVDDIRNRIYKECLSDVIGLSEKYNINCEHKGYSNDCELIIENDFDNGKWIKLEEIIGMKRGCE